MEDKWIFGLIAIFIIVFGAFLSMELIYGSTVNITDCIDHNVSVEVSDSGSKALYSIDNLIGAKNKVFTNDKKDYYEIDGYIFDNGDFVQLIYPNGKQNNADRKECILNGNPSEMVKIYGKDGDKTIRINYTVWKHDNITVNFVNEIGGRYTSISNNIGKDGSWSNNGKLFDNQISGLEFIETENGNYTFIGWMNDLGEFVNNFRFDYIGNQLLQFTYTAIYDFIPVPVDNSTDNSTDDNETVPIDNSTVVDNSTNDTSINNGSIVPVKQNETVKHQNNKTSVKSNDSPSLDNKNNTVTPISDNKEIPISHVAGHSLAGTLLLLLFFAGLVYISRK